MCRWWSSAVLESGRELQIHKQTLGTGLIISFTTAVREEERRLLQIYVADLASIPKSNFSSPFVYMQEIEG